MKKLLYQSLEPLKLEFYISTTPLLEYGGYSLTSKARQARFSLCFYLKMAQNQRLSRICKLTVQSSHEETSYSSLRSTVGAKAPTSHKETLFAPHSKQQLRKTFQLSKNGQNVGIMTYCSHINKFCVSNSAFNF